MIATSEGHEQTRKLATQGKIPEQNTIRGGEGTFKAGEDTIKAIQYLWCYLIL